MLLSWLREITHDWGLEKCSEGGRKEHAWPLRSGGQSTRREGGKIEENHSEEVWVWINLRE